MTQSQVLFGRGASGEARTDEPVIIFGSETGAQTRLLSLFETYKPIVVDAISDQIEELYWIRHPFGDSSNPADVDACRQFVENYSPTGSNRWQLGNWVYWPWRNTLVHVLPEDEYFEVRTSRNRNLINAEEQRAFRSAHVAVAGLSVGNSIALMLSVMGGPKRMHLADFDRLALSNMNRIRTGAHSIGLYKTHVAANEILEIDPYADLKLFPEGFTLENAEAFLGGERPIDVLVEEMDNIYLKVRIRLLCRQKRIPIVMVTDNGDGIMIGVERYDLDPSYPMFHGAVSEEELLAVTPQLPRLSAARLIARLVGISNTTPRMIESLKELKKALYTWPQLGGAALLGGCAASYAVRRIICKQPIRSGQWAISLEELCDPEYHTAEGMQARQQIQRGFANAVGVPFEGGSS